ncbi:hypothetical protein MBLNU457_6437t1 [Dothideomycetes sp. NU457]
MRFSFALLTSLASVALADVAFVSPAPGASLPAGPITITFKDSGVAPAISTLQSYQLFLMAGGNSAANSIQLSALVPSGTFASLTTTGTITPGLGGTGENAYYLKMVSVASQGGTIINYSNRFTLTGMTGTFPPNVVQGIAAIAGSTAGPPTVNNVANNAAPAAGNTPAAAAPAGDEYLIPYQSQTGLTKYAPMQPVPGTKITATAFTPLHPTSAFTIATTYMGTPIVATTITASQTFSVSSMENTVAAASAPTGDMAKFLRRWVD